MISEQAPLIGITTYGEQAAWTTWDVPAVVLPRSYAVAVAAAGGIPVLIPPLAGAVEPALNRLDGLVVAGGPDVDPALYQEAADGATGAPRPERDATELELIRRAVAERLPVLGVCRGLQLLNVLRGGTLIQHLPDRVGHTGHAERPGWYGLHRVSVDPDSRLAGVLGRLDLDVPTCHHQAIDRLGADLRVTARHQDGTVEAAEDPSLPFCLAVQWHPEEGEDISLFTALVEAASRRPAMVLRPGSYVPRAGARYGEPGRDAARPAAARQPGEVGRDLERLADRLRVVGPRLAARSGGQAAQALEDIRRGLQHLADRSADADGRRRREVPRLGGHALADQLLVLGHDHLSVPAADAAGRAAELADLLADLRPLI